MVFLLKGRIYKKKEFCKSVRFSTFLALVQFGQLVRTLVPQTFSDLIVVGIRQIIGGNDITTHDLSLFTEIMYSGGKKSLYR